MNPEWSRYAARLKHTEVVGRAIDADPELIGPLTMAMIEADSIESVKSKRFKKLLKKAAAELDSLS